MNENNDLEFHRIEFIPHAESLKEILTGLLDAIENGRRLNMKQFNVATSTLQLSSLVINQMLKENQQRGAVASA